ncbi:hypothetical protein J6590_028547 [Homalodisca vitripennis]|nr:hypothetical protein J6590_028547 [Homalodisca vitripennis]
MTKIIWERCGTASVLLEGEFVCPQGTEITLWDKHFTSWATTVGLLITLCTAWPAPSPATEPEEEDVAWDDGHEEEPFLEADIVVDSETIPIAEIKASFIFLALTMLYILPCLNIFEAIIYCIAVRSVLTQGIAVTTILEAGKISELPNID